MLAQQKQFDERTRLIGPEVWAVLASKVIQVAPTFLPSLIKKKTKEGSVCRVVQV